MASEAPHILAILCVRNEGAFLLDWLAHHKACGISHVLAFTNDCDDGTDALLDRLEALGHVTHLRNDGPYDQGGIQFTALKTAARTDELRRADWILPLDVDEFVNVHVGDRTLPALIAALPEAQAITLTWRLFGNSGIARYEDRPVPERFLRAAPAVMFWPWRAAMFKTLYRNDGTYRKPGVHRPRDPDGDRALSARWFDGEGRELDAQFRTRRIFSNFGQSNTALAQLNHYPLGDMESYVLKAARGRAVHSDHVLDLDYWVERNFNTDEDRSILALAPKAAEHRAALAADPELARLHEAAVQWRKAQFEALMLEEPFRALLGRLMTTPPSRPLSRREAAFLVHYGQKARALSDAGTG
ncbi:glycosyltransferase family 2 protein [Litorisediminicola beolgyonensis]|uniref:Glycosyltransferase family 2 protein n=1 Tax=Litorisediminicola beolgyonensis TaxID=1173614 RepID=A0ABW3ZKB7_9RHOB